LLASYYWQQATHKVAGDERQQATMGRGQQRGSRLQRGSGLQEVVSYKEVVGNERQQATLGTRAYKEVAGCA